MYFIFCVTKFTSNGDRNNLCTTVKQVEQDLAEMCLHCPLTEVPLSTLSQYKGPFMVDLDLHSKERSFV